jgi:hypothetical protein
MKLLAVATRQKHDCLSVLAKSETEIKFRIYFNISKRIKGYPVISGYDLWTTGSDPENIDIYSWCSMKKAVDRTQVNWRDGEPNAANGDCMHFQLSNSSASESKFAIGNCEEQKRFVCEVFQIIKKSTLQPVKTVLESDISFAAKFNRNNALLFTAIKKAK